LESWVKEIDTLSISCLVMDKERIEAWPVVRVSVSFSALTLMVGWQEGHLACKNHHSTNPRSSVPQQMERGGPKGEPAGLASPGRKPPLTKEVDVVCLYVRCNTGQIHGECKASARAGAEL